MASKTKNTYAKLIRGGRRSKKKRDIKLEWDIMRRHKTGYANWLRVTCSRECFTVSLFWLNLLLQAEGGDTHAAKHQLKPENLHRPFAPYGWLWHIETLRLCEKPFCTAPRRLNECVKELHILMWDTLRAFFSALCCWNSFILVRATQLIWITTLSSSSSTHPLRLSLACLILILLLRDKYQNCFSVERQTDTACHTYDYWKKRSRHTGKEEEKMLNWDRFRVIISSEFQICCSTSVFLLFLCVRAAVWNSRFKFAGI